MPATVNMSVGSSLTSDADGTTVCSLASKKFSHLRLISAVLIPVATGFLVIEPLSPTRAEERVHWGGGSRLCLEDSSGLLRHLLEALLRRDDSRPEPRR